MLSAAAGAGKGQLLEDVVELGEDEEVEWEARATLTGVVVHCQPGQGVETQQGGAGGGSTKSMRYMYI